MMENGQNKKSPETASRPGRKNSEAGKGNRGRATAFPQRAEGKGNRKDGAKPKAGSGRAPGGEYRGKPAPAAGRPVSRHDGRNGGRPFPGKRTPAAAGQMEGLAARRIALKVIREVTEGGAYASLSLDKNLAGSGLSAVDRRLATRLAYDTLDRMIYLDHCLSQVMAREDTDIKLKNILRLGACQILAEDRIPESAATNTSVELCAELGMEGLRGVCNGILRNLVRKKEELEMPDPETEPDRSFSIRQSMPEWLAGMLRKDYGDQAEEIASFRTGDPWITVRPNLTMLSDEEFEKILPKKIWAREKTDIPHAWHIRGAMDIASDSDFLAGKFSIQSASSMMACMALDPKRGKQILDCCAAPGGKSCLIAEMMGGTGRVQAWDLHEHRVALITAQARRLQLENIRPIIRDAAKFREDLVQSMDGVLLDAPCSGTGVLSEKPDIKLRITEESVESLTELQGRLLDTVSAYVRQGGMLVYSTCSILKDENERQIEAFLNRHPEFEVSALPESIPERYRRFEALGLQLLEHRDGTEGFYICRMRRKHDD